MYATDVLDVECELAAIESSCARRLPPDLGRSRRRRLTPCRVRRCLGAHPVPSRVPRPEWFPRPGRRTVPWRMECSRVGEDCPLVERVSLSGPTDRADTTGGWVCLDYMDARYLAMLISSIQPLDTIARFRGRLCRTRA